MHQRKNLNLKIRPKNKTNKNSRKKSIQLSPGKKLNYKKKLLLHLRRKLLLRHRKKLLLRLRRKYWQRYKKKLVLRLRKVALWVLSNSPSL